MKVMHSVAFGCVNENGCSAKHKRGRKMPEHGTRGFPPLCCVSVLLMSWILRWPLSVRTHPYVIIESDGQRFKS